MANRAFRSCTACAKHIIEYNLDLHMNVVRRYIIRGCHRPHTKVYRTSLNRVSGIDTKLPLSKD